MKLIFSLGLLFWANTAFAHPGHIADLAGHNHWLAGAAIAAAAAALAWGLLKGKKSKDENEEVDEEDTSDTEAEAA